MQRLSGIEIDDVAALDVASVDRPQLAKDIACIIKEVLEDGFFHTDPHPGSFFVMEEAVIGVIDFDMVGHLDQRDGENPVWP